MFLVRSSNTVRAAAAVRKLATVGVASTTPATATTTAAAAAKAQTTGRLLLLQLRASYATKEFPKHVRVPMPALSPTMTSGNIGKWNKKIGDQVSPGDVLVEIETDKATMDFEIQEEGYLAKILVETGAKDVPVNKLLAILAENKGDVPAFKDYTESSAPAAPSSQSTSTVAPVEPTPAPAQAAAAPQPTPQPTPQPAPAAAAAPQPPSSAGDRKFASPLAKKLAEERNIPLNLIKGTGPNGRIVKDDVLNYVPTKAVELMAAASTPQAAKPIAAAATTTAAAAVNFTDMPASKIRKIIAQRLTESKQTVPHFYLTIDLNMEKILNLRATLNARAGDKYKLSVNDFIIKASAKALMQVPEVNSAWMGEFVRRYHHADISVAVATETGLITPIIFGADTKGLVSISEQVKQLAAKARDGKLAPQEYQGGSFSISNLGMYGIKSFTAIINPPQSCILAVGASEKRVIPSDKSPNGFETATMMTVTLSCDHRVVDGAVGAQWLQHFKTYIEEPTTMLL